jgi:hypothetical protein
VGQKKRSDLMGFLRSGNQQTQVTKYSGLQIQTTSSALPVPIIYGCNLVAPNVIWYQNFQAHSQKSGGKGGGKGGGGSKNATSYSYSADIIMGVCEGPVSAIPRVWQGSPTPTTLAALNLNLVAGASPQAVWSYLATKYPAQALAYNGTCYVAAASFNLGSAGTISDNNFEVYGFFQGTGCNGADADPSQVVYDFLTNAQYGVGFPAASISGAALLGASGGSSFQAYCWAAGIAISPVLNSQESAASILSRWLQITNSTAIWSDGMLKIIPYGDGSISGNGWTWTANTTPLYSLTDEDYRYDAGTDPVQITRTDPYAAANWLSVEAQSRSDSYNTGPITAFDQSAIDRFGLRVGPTVAAHEICDIGIAQTVAQLILQRGLYIRNTYQFKLGPEFCILEPMDLIQLTDAPLGLSAVTVRITEIEEDDSGDLSITAEEFPAGVATSVAYPIQAKSNGAPNTNVVMNSINPPLIIEPPPTLTGNQVELWIGVSPQSGDPNWGGCIVYASLDGTSYAQVTTINQPANQGVLSASLPSYGGVNPDTIDTLAVDLTESLGAMSSSNSAAAAAGVSLCYVGGEFLSYTTATLTAASKYNLTGLYRGQGGVASVSAASGAPFCVLDSAVLQYAVPSAEIGQTIYLKFCSFNIYGQQLQSLAACAAYSYAITGTGVLGPVASALSVGTAMDYGLIAGESIAETDDFGNVVSTVTSVIDLGNVTS